MENEKTIHGLLCYVCKERFTIQTEEKDNKKIELDKKFCPACGRQTIQLDPLFFPQPESKIEARRKANKEASAFAQQQASAYQSGLPKEEMIAINSPEEKGRNKKTEIVPKKIVESIQEKLNPNNPNN